MIINLYLLFSYASVLKQQKITNHLIFKIAFYKALFIYSTNTETVITTVTTVTTVTVTNITLLH